MFLGFFIAQYMTFFTFTTNLETTKKIEMINLGRSLVQDFYKEDEKAFRDIRTAIESCDKLYNGFNKSGKFSNDQINRYLGFFDDLGFFYRIKVLDIDVIDQFFGAYIIEAYEYNELRKYIKDLQEKAHQKTAFKEFQALSEALENLPDRKDLIEDARRGCIQ